jgi:hypothetical protein
MHEYLLQNKPKDRFNILSKSINLGYWLVESNIG